MQATSAEIATMTSDSAATSNPPSEVPADFATPPAAFASSSAANVNGYGKNGGGSPQDSSLRFSVTPELPIAPLTPAAAAALNAPTRSGHRHAKTVLSFSEKGPRGQAKEPITSVLSTSTFASATTVGGGPVLRYRTDLDKPVIHFVFEQLGRPVEEINVPFKDEDERDANTCVGEWHFFWMSVSRIRNIFSAAEFRLQDSQIINHFPNHYELTRKDLMYKNIKRYLRENNTSSTQKRLTLVTAADWVAAAANGIHAPQPGFGSPRSPLAISFGSGFGANGAGISSSVAGGGGQGRVTHFRFADAVPITYNIPNDMSMFTEEFKRHPGATWIVKPTSRSQGKGIFLINRIQQLTRWIKEKKDVDGDGTAAPGNTTTTATAAGGNVASGSPTGMSSPTAGNSTPPPFHVPASAVRSATAASSAGSPPLESEPTAASAAEKRQQQEHLNNLMGTFVVSKYIANPLLIGGKKFDMRLYVLVTSYKPLVAYLHEEGFARFCATRYAGKSLAQGDLGSHLTNVALQKGDENYNTTHGGKWSLKNVFLYIQGRYGPYTAEGLIANIEFLIYHSLKAMESVMFNDKHCFELYGYDILIDEDIKPHLIEVNASPSLSATTTSDRLLKEEVLADTLRIVLPPGYPSSRAASYHDHRTRTDIAVQQRTGFRLLQFL